MGTLLLDLLAVACARVGIVTVAAEVLSANTAMLAMVARREAKSIRMADDPAVTSVELSVSALCNRIDHDVQDRIRNHLDGEQPGHATSERRSSAS